MTTLTLPTDLHAALDGFIATLDAACDIDVARCIYCHDSGNPCPDESGEWSEYSVAHLADMHERSDSFLPNPRGTSRSPERMHHEDNTTQHPKGDQGP